MKKLKMDTQTTDIEKNPPLRQRLLAIHSEQTKAIKKIMLRRTLARKIKIKIVIK